VKRTPTQNLPFTLDDVWFRFPSFAGEDGKGNSWIEFNDAPGFPGAHLGQNIPASTHDLFVINVSVAAREVAQVLNKADGQPVGEPVTGVFWSVYSGYSDSATWKWAVPPVPHPAFPATWPLPIAPF
jgi:hypothetical protein